MLGFARADSSPLLKGLRTALMLINLLPDNSLYFVHGKPEYECYRAVPSCQTYTPAFK